MGDKSKIEWTEATWNPVVGCTKVSPGCKNCYAERLHEQRRTAFKLGKEMPYQYHTSFDYIQTLDERLDAPLHWRKPRRIFVNSMSDLFHEDVPDDFIDRVFALMALCPQHTFQILTKRAARMRAYMNRLARSPGCADQVSDAARQMGHAVSFAWPFPNVWLGVSVESADYKDRIDELRRTPAAVRFVSAEPLLGALDVSDQLRTTTLHHVAMSVSGALRNKAFDGLTDSDGEPLSRKEAQAQLELLQASGVKLVPTGGCEGFSDQTGCPGHPLPGLDWVIVGGESGPGARPMHPDWARGLRDQCAAAGVPFFFKQWGEWAPVPDERRYESLFTIHGKGVGLKADGSIGKVDGQAMERVGKKRAGRLLDGREWNEYPALANGPAARDPVAPKANGAKAGALALLFAALLCLAWCGSMDRLRVVERSGEDRDAVAVASFVEELRRGEDARAYQAWGRVLPAPAKDVPGPESLVLGLDFAGAIPEPGTRNAEPERGARE